MNHFQKYAKAYTGGISAGSVGPAAATIVLWLLSLTGLEIPEQVRSAIEYLTTAVVTTGIVALVGNNISPEWRVLSAEARNSGLITQDSGLSTQDSPTGRAVDRLLRERIDWTKRLRR